MMSKLEAKEIERESKKVSSGGRQAVYHLFGDAVLRDEFVTFHVDENSFRKFLRTNQEVREFLRMADFPAINTHHTIDLTNLLENEEAAQLFWEELSRAGSFVYQHVRDFDVKPRSLLLVCLNGRVSRELAELESKPEILYAVYAKEKFCAWTGGKGALYRRDYDAGYGDGSYKESSNRFDILTDIPNESDAMRYARVINTYGEKVRRTYSCYEFSQYCGVRAYKADDTNKKTTKDLGTLPLETDWRVENS